MAILNYTTTIDAFKTVAEIEKILVQHKAKSIMKHNFIGPDEIKGLKELPLRIPDEVPEIKYDVHTLEAKKDEYLF